MTKAMFFRLAKAAALCCFAVILGSCAKKSPDSIVYYNERVIIIWSHTAEEYAEILSKYSDEDRAEVAGDGGYYMAEAQEYIVNSGIAFAGSSAESIGFIHGQDTTVLNRKEMEFFYGIVLFDAKTEPVVVAPIDIRSDEYSWFFRGEQRLIDAVRTADPAKFANFKLHDSLLINVDDEGWKIYLLILKHNEEDNGIVLGCKYKNDTLALLDVNEVIMKDDSDIENHSLIKSNDSTVYLYLEYGPNVRNGTNVYLSFSIVGGLKGSESVYVDSSVMWRKVFDEDEVDVEYAHINYMCVGRPRLYEMSLDEHCGEIEFKKRDPNQTSSDTTSTPQHLSFEDSLDIFVKEGSLVELKNSDLFGESAEGGEMRLFLDAKTKDSILVVRYYGETGQAACKYVFNKKLIDAERTDYDYAMPIYINPRAGISSVTKETLKTSKEAEKKLTDSFAEYRKKLSEAQ